MLNEISFVNKISCRLLSRGRAFVGTCTSGLFSSLPHSTLYAMGKPTKIEDLALRIGRVLAAVALTMSLAAGATEFCYAQSAIPSFRDARQRIARPDVSAFTRLRFLTTTDFFPFNFLDGNGRLSGFHVDLARAICRELEMLDRCQIQALPFEELEDAIESGAGEALIAGVAVTPERRLHFLFTRPYLQFPARFVARKAAAGDGAVQFPGRPVGVLADTAHEEMLRDLFPNAHIVTYMSETELADDLKAGRIDAIFGDGMRLSFWLASEEANACCAFTGGPYLAPEYLGRGLAIAVRSNQPVLATAVDYALEEIEADGTFAELYLRYFPISFF